jgi:hypothetical protein
LQDISKILESKVHIQQILVARTFCGTIFSSDAILISAQQKSGDTMAKLSANKAK